MTDKTDLNEIVSMLYQQTERKHITWMMSGSSLISTKLGDSLIEITENLPDQLYTISIRNQNGITLSSKILNSIVDKSDVYDLFRTVKRAALGVDNAIKDMKLHLQRFG